MTEKIKKRLVMSGLIIVCVGLVIGIASRLYKEDTTPVAAENEVETETEVVIDPESKEDVTDTEELVIEPEDKVDVNANEQTIQSDPVKTEDIKPTEAPTVTEDANLEEEAVKPAYTEKTPAVTTKDSTPKNGDKKDGMIYIDGFGWVVDEGGGGEGTIDDQMYENGNKVGIMD